MSNDIIDILNNLEDLKIKSENESAKEIPDNLKKLNEYFAKLNSTF